MALNHNDQLLKPTMARKKKPATRVAFMDDSDNDKSISSSRSGNIPRVPEPVVVE